MVIATGWLDGVHLGHRLVIEHLKSAAKERGTENRVVTFWPHPRNVLQKDARNLRLLNSLDEKKELLLSMGVDAVEVLDFTKEFSKFTAEEYLRDYVIGKFGGSAIILGYDNRMGCDSVDTEQVAEIAERLGIEVIRPERLSSESGTAVSSTWIRSMLEAGSVETAAQMLGYEYSLKGVVVAGEQFGRTIGFPTANMQLYEPLKLVPANGVYFVRVETLGTEYYGMCNIGMRPTVSKANIRTIETHIFDFDEDIYGLDIRISFLSRLRGERCFTSADALKRQLEVDRDECLKLI